MGGGGGDTNVKLKHIYQASQFCTCACNLLSLYCQRGGKNTGGVGHSRPINETILLCRVIGNVHTVVSVYSCVVGGKYELGVYADGVI